MRVMVSVTAIQDEENRAFPASRRTGTTAAPGDAMGRFAAKLMACAIFLTVTGTAVADPVAPYPSMASIDAYLMDRTQEIALAKSRRPPPFPRTPPSWS